LELTPQSQRLTHPKIAGALTTWVNGIGVFKTTFIEPLIQFPGRQDLGTGSIGDANHICHVIVVGMLNKNIISLNLIDVNGCGQLVGCDKGVEEKRFSACKKREARMSVVIKFHMPSFFIDSCVSLFEGQFFQQRCNEPRFNSLLRVD
jgi:hypothetical protein